MLLKMDELMNLHANDLGAFEERLGEEGTATDYFEGVKKAGPRQRLRSVLDGVFSSS